MAANALFSIGDVVHHKLFDYRGVIVDVDPHGHYLSAGRVN